MTRRPSKVALGVAAAAAVGVACAGAAPAAHAGYFPGQAVDGPSADIDSVGGVALARDGGGQVVYLKRESGANHVFVSLLSSGAPRQSQRLDVSQTGASTQPRVAVSDGGRALVVWVNGGSLWGSLRPDGRSAWGEPKKIYDPANGGGARAANPDLAMTTHGAGYVAFTVNGDVRAARLAGDTWTLNERPLDIDPARTASEPDIAASADGTAVASFTETGNDGIGHVYVRRVVRNRLSEVPQEANAPDLGGIAGGSAGAPSIDIEDDSSYAWVVFRQDFAGTTRLLSRRLVGSTLTPPVVVDGNLAPADTPAFDMTGKGRGLLGAGVNGSGQTVGAPLRAGDEWAAGTPLGGGSLAPTKPTAAIAENGRGTVAWFQQSDAGTDVLGRYYNARVWSDPTSLRAPEFGAADASRGLYSSADASGNQAIAFVQGSGADRRVVVALFDKEPRTTGGGNRSKWSRDQRPSFTWSRIEDTWGSITYRIDIDGVPQSTLTGTRWTPSGDLPDGAHVWNVVAVDSRGQTTIGPERAIRVDTRRPEVEIEGGRVKRGRPAPITITATDGAAIEGSGIASVNITFGNGARSSVTVPKIGFMEEKAVGYRYPRPGRYTVRVVVKDKAGNQRVAKTQVRVTR